MATSMSFRFDTSWIDKLKIWHGMNQWVKDLTCAKSISYRFDMCWINEI